MDQIPASLEQLIRQLEQTVDSISKGKILTRTSAENFTGEFGQLVGGINQMAEVLCSYLDKVPNPVLIIDTGFNVQYVNQAGLDLAGISKEESMQSRCHELFCTGDCQTEKCATALAMQDGQNHESETNARPAGRNRQLPLLNPRFRRGL